MAILFAGSEMDAFVTFDEESVTANTSTNFDSDYARGAMRCTNAAYIQANWASTTSIWIHFIATWASTPDAQMDSDYFYVYSSADVACLRGDMQNGDVLYQYWDGAAWQNIGSGTLHSPVENTEYTIDININIADSGGFYKVYIDGSLWEETGNIDTNVTDVAAVDYLRLYSSNRDSFDRMDYSEVICADESTIDWRLQTLEATAAGTTSDWTGAYTDIDDTVIVDKTDIIETDTATDVVTYACANMSTPAKAVGEIKGVVVSCQARASSASAPQSIDGVVRVNSTDYNSAASNLDIGYEIHQFIWDVSPDTAVLWTSTEVDAMEFGFEANT